MSAYLKKKKANKRKEGSKDKKDKEDPKKDPPPNREPSKETKRANSISYKGPRAGSQENFYNVCVQLKLREEMDSEDTDSDNESYNTPPESNQEEDNEDTPAVEDVDPIDANTAELTDDFEKDILFDNESKIEEFMNNPPNDTTVE